MPKSCHSCHSCPVRVMHAQRLANCTLARSTHAPVFWRAHGCARACDAPAAAAADGGFDSIVAE
eukprot:11196162-Lingulodinium_polyedra.AAC.1